MTMLILIDKIHNFLLNEILGEGNLFMISAFLINPSVLGISLSDITYSST